jgi:hypothetical protein
MRRHRRIVASALAAAVSLVVVPPTFAASGVFGGATSDDEAIVLTTDAKAKRLRSAIIAWEADCDDGRLFPAASELTAVAPSPGFTPAPDELLMSKNGKGRFSGTQFAASDLGAQVAAISVDVTGRLRPASARGRLRATVSILDTATGTEVATCETGDVTWSASRGAGRIYGGKTSQGEPVVVRLDRKRKRVANLLVGWETSTCQPPDRYMRFGERFTGFTVRGRRFGDTFDSSFPTDDGGHVAFAYDVAGSVSRRSVKGTLKITVNGTDASGASTIACDSGAVDWRTSTG